MKQKKIQIQNRNPELNLTPKWKKDSNPKLKPRFKPKIETFSNLKTKSKKNPYPKSIYKSKFKLKIAKT